MESVLAFRFPSTNQKAIQARERYHQHEESIPLRLLMKRVLRKKKISYYLQVQESLEAELFSQSYEMLTSITQIVQ